LIVVPSNVIVVSVQDNGLLSLSIVVFAPLNIILVAYTLRCSSEPLVCPSCLLRWTNDSTVPYAFPLFYNDILLKVMHWARLSILYLNGPDISAILVNLLNLDMLDSIISSISYSTLFIYKLFIANLSKLLFSSTSKNPLTSIV